MVLPTPTPFINYNDYLAFGGDPKLTDVIFPTLVIKAQYMIENITRHFYLDKTDWENDPIEFRRVQYAKAIAMQTNYLFDNGSLTLANMARQPQSQSIGETTVSYGSGLVTSAGVVMTICPEAIDCLEGTGFLYRGESQC